MITLILTRHGETDWNRDGKLAGSSNFAVLTEEGVRQTETLAKKLKDYKIDKIYCSKLRRAKHTAKIIAKYHKKKIIYSSAFNERSWGTFEGENWEESKEKLILAYESKNSNVRPKGGETYSEFEKRILEELENIIKNNEAKSVLIVTHGGVIRSLIKILKKVTDEEMSNIRISNTSLKIFKMNEDNVEEQLIADIDHLTK